MVFESLEARCLLAASPITVNGSASGVFVDPQPLGAVVSGEGTSEFTWGVPGEGFSQPCWLAFGGRSFTATPKGKNDYFSLGTLSYYNSTTQAGTEADAVDLDVTLSFRTPAGTKPKTFNFPLQLLNSPNTDDPIASADSVFLSMPSDRTQVFKTPSGGQYSLELAGFGAITGEGFQEVNKFFVLESESASAELLGRFVPVPDIVPSKLRWDTQKGGLSISYQIVGANLDSDSVLALYWARGTTFEDRLGDPIVTKPLAKKIGKYGPIHVSGSLLVNAPAGTTHLIVVADPENKISESLENNNVKALADVSIEFAADARSDVVSDYTLQVLSELLRKAGESSARITSTLRTPEEQAMAMFNLIQSQGLQAAYGLYGPNGDKVIHVYEDWAKDLGNNQQQIAAHRAEIEADMTAKIRELGPSNVSKHCAEIEDYARLNVIDVAPSSFTASTKKLFVKAVGADSRVVGFRQPPLDPAYHLPIPQG
jgi:hypothetical protein